MPGRGHGVWLVHVLPAATPRAESERAELPGGAHAVLAVGPGSISWLEEGGSVHGRSVFF